MIIEQFEITEEIEAEIKQTIKLVTDLLSQNNVRGISGILALRAIANQHEMTMGIQVLKPQNIPEPMPDKNGKRVIN